MPAVSFDAVASNLVVAGSLAVVAAVVGRCRRPAVAHALWLLVLVKLVTPPLFIVPVRILPAVEPVAEAQAAAVEPAPVAKAGPILEIVIRNDAPATPPSVEVTASPPVAARQPFPWPAAVTAVWLTGAAAWVLVTALHVRRFAKYLRFAADAPDPFTREVAKVAARLGLTAPRVMLLPGEVAPFVWSLGRTTLYFPINLIDRLSADQRQMVVAHELAHVWRRDHLVRWLELAAVAAYWWCPLAWAARRELRRLEEDCCDSVVVAAYPGAGPTYAAAILDTIDFLATAPATPRLASAMGDVRSLRGRLTRILNGAPPSALSRTVRLGLIAFAVVLLAAGPRLARLAATVLPTAAADRQTQDVPSILEPRHEAVQYLPTPIRLKLADSVEAITAAALSPDGRRLAVAVGSQVMVWDLESKRVELALTGHAGVVNAVAFSPDGKRLASAGNDAAVKVWDLAGGTHRTLAGHGNWVLAVAFAPDGRRLASAGYGRAVLVHDLADDGVLTLEGHAAAVRAVAFSPDGRRMASAGADQAVKLWDAVRGVEERTLAGHAAAVRAVAFAPDGRTLTSGGEDRVVRVWNLADGTAAQVRSPDVVTTLSFSAGGGVLFAGTFGGHVLNINPAAGKLRGHVGPPQPTHEDAIAAVLPSATGHLLFTASHDGTVLVWPSAGLPESALRVFRGLPAVVTGVAVSADGRLVAAGGSDGSIRVWNAATAAEVARLDGHAGGVTGLAFLDATRLLSAGHDERLRVWDAKQGKQLRAMVVPAADLTFAVSPTGKTVAVAGSQSAGVTLWDTDAGTQLRRIATKLDGVSAVAFTPDGRKLAVGTASAEVVVFRLPDGKEEQRVALAESGRVERIAFSRDGGRAAVAINSDGDDPLVGRHEVVFWDVWSRSADESLKRLAHPGRVNAVAFDRTETRLLAAGHDGRVIEWDVATGRRTQALHAHREAVLGLAVPADGRTILSAGDQFAKLWEWPPEKQP